MGWATEKPLLPQGELHPVSENIHACMCRIRQVFPRFFTSSYLSITLPFPAVSFGSDILSHRKVKSTYMLLFIFVLVLLWCHLSCKPETTAPVVFSFLTTVNVISVQLHAFMFMPPHDSITHCVCVREAFTVSFYACISLLLRHVQDVSVVAYVSHESYFYTLAQHPCLCWRIIYSKQIKWSDERRHETTICRCFVLFF